MHRVAITGLGVTSSAGRTRTPFLTTLRSSRGHIDKIRRFEAREYRCQVAACIDESILDSLPRRTNPSLWDLSALAGLAAAEEALQDAGFQQERPSAELTSLAIFWGSAVGGIISLDEQFRNFYRKGKRWVLPSTVPKTMVSSAPSLIAIELGIQGPNCTFASACSASTHAAAHAFQQIRYGVLERCLVGGSDAPVSPGHLQAWDRMRALSTDNSTPQRACRPFSRNRSGLVLGEAAAVLIFERLDLARRAGKRIYGEIKGVGTNCDSLDLIRPSSEGQERSIRTALQSAGWAKALPDYIATHGTATQDGDRSEAAALESVFGPKLRKIATSSIKGAFGHTLGASGALSMAATLLGMSEGFAPPTLNYEESDPDCPLDCVPNTPRAMTIEKALINSFAFGGSNVVLAMQRV